MWKEREREREKGGGEGKGGRQGRRAGKKCRLVDNIGARLGSETYFGS